MFVTTPHYFDLSSYLHQKTKNAAKEINIF